MRSAGLEEVSFGYSGQQGPNNWGNLNPKYQQCVVGKSQSPISISTDHLLLNSTLKPLTRDYRPGKATLINRGFVVGVCTSITFSFFLPFFLFFSVLFSLPIFSLYYG